MRVPRHWVREAVEAKDSRGEVHRGEAWGWSETDVEEARRRARTSAERVADWLVRGGEVPQPPRSAAYLYNLDRPPREEIVQELPDAAGDVAGLITRNRFGALVLTTRDLMFVDVDFPQPKRQQVGLLKLLFGNAAPPEDLESETLSRVRTWCAEHADDGVRLYRTAAGLRVAIVGRPVLPRSDESRRILQQLGSDPNYQRLCESQECYRARLTPKPWRMGDDATYAPEVRYPFASDADEQLLRRWQRKYEQAAVQFATCQLVNAYGDQEAHPELSPLLKLHDSLTGVGNALPLA